MTTPPAAYPQPYYAPGWNLAPPKRTDGISIAALVTGLLGLGPVAIGLGIGGLARTRRNGTGGRGMAWAGIILGVIGTAVAIALGVLAVTVANATRPLPATVTAPEEVLVGRLVVGNCVGILAPDGSIQAIRVVPCSTPHQAQVVASGSLPTVSTAGTAPPSQGSLDNRATQFCSAALDLAVNPSAPVTAAHRAAGVRIIAWAPSPAGWQIGDHQALCLAFLPAGGLTGSFVDASVTLP
jgi:hypothetical protein